MTRKSVFTRGRLCRWYDGAGNVVTLTVDVWDKNHELVTSMVADVGPFDDVATIEAQMVEALTAQLELPL